MENGVESIKALADSTVSSVTQLLAIEQQLNNL